MPRTKFKTVQPEYTGPPRYWLYRRVSSPGQVEREISLPAQASEMRAHVTARGGIITAEFEDKGISAGTAEDRPEFMAMSAAARSQPRPCEVILFHNSDRVFRNHEDATIHKAMWRRAGVRVESVTEPFVGGDSPGDRIVETIIDVMNEEYLRKLAREVHKGLKQVATSEGRQNGRPPYGYKWKDLSQRGSGWIIDEAEATWVRWIFAQAIAGRSNVAIARELTLTGIEPPNQRAGIRGGGYQGTSTHWGGTTIRHILANKKYTGWVHYRGQWFRGAHEPIIDESTYEQAIQIAAGRGHGCTPLGTGVYADGICLCPVCWDRGEKTQLWRHMQSKILKTTEERIEYRYLRCGLQRKWERRRTHRDPELPARPCSYTINEAAIDAMFRQALTDLIGDVDTSRFKPVEPPSGAREEDIERRREAITTELASVPTERDNYIRMAARGRLDEAELDRYLDELNMRKRVLEKALESVARETNERRLPTPAEAWTLLQALDSDLSPLAKRDMIKRWIHYAIPSRDKQGITLYWRV